MVKSLDKPKLLEITEEDYAIFKTPEGKLYHQHLVDDAFEINLDTKHVKKTSKVYSHKEQVMMLEEKKAEIERKRREGKLELTPKQKEILKSQTEKEAVIRKRYFQTFFFFWGSLFSRKLYLKNFNIKNLQTIVLSCVLFDTCSLSWENIPGVSGFVILKNFY